MAITYSTNLKLTLIGTGDQAGTWGNTTNTNLGTLIEQAIAGYVSQTVADSAGSPTSLSIADGTSSAARNMVLVLQGALSAPRDIILPTSTKLYFIHNNTSGGFAVTAKCSGQTGVSIPAGAKVILACNGTDIVEAFNYSGSLIFPTSATITTLSGTTLGYGSASITNASIASGTVTNLLATTFSGGSASITTVTGTTFGTTGVTQLRGASGNIGQLTVTSATITNLNVSSLTTGNFPLPTSATIATLSGTTLSYASASLTNVSIGSGTVSGNFNAATASGNVGIGTTSPVSKLDVNGDVNTAQNSFISSNLYFSGGWKYKENGYGGFLKLAESAGGVSLYTSGLNSSGSGASATVIQAISVATNGSVTAPVDMRSPIFYDSANTAYYLDPANTVTALNVAGNINCGAGIYTGTGISTGDCAFELGGNRTGSGNAYIDIHSTSGTDFESRIIRYSGTNGGLDIINTGTGGMVLSVSGDAPVVFQTNGTEKARIRGDGNFGIGTNNPSSKLVVAGTNPVVTSKATSGYGGFYADGATGSAAYYFFAVNGTETARITSDANNSLVFSTESSATERMRITDAGNVGIGVTSVGQKLVVRQDQNDSTRIAVSNQDSGSSADSGIRLSSFGGSWDIANGSSAKNTNALTFGQVGGSERMRIDSSGNVGIGNNNPTFKLDVGGSFRVANDGGGGVGGLWTMRNTASGATNPDKNFRVGATGSLEIINNAYNSIPFTLTDSGTLFAGEAVQAPIYYDVNNTAFYVNPNGTSNINDLVVNGFIQGRSCADTNVNTANDTGSISIRGSSTTVAAMSFHRTGAYAINMGLGTDNVFRIGGWSASNNCLQMDGSGNLTMLNNVTAYSDARLKTDVVKIENALDKVQQLNGYTYTRTDTGSKQTGVIAQEVMKVLPEVVMGSEDTHYSVAYGNMVGLLIEAIKEQQGQINELKLTIEQLKGN